MNKTIKSSLQVIFSLAIGFFLIWIFYKELTEEDKANIVLSFKKANYWWIGLSTIIAILSHVFRAYRWRYTLEPLSIKIDFLNRFAAVMIGYLANLAFPRLGEVSRCAVLARYQKQPFEKLFGTVVAERLVDAIILLSIILITIITQISILRELIADLVGPLLEKAQNQVVLGVIVLLVIIGAVIGWRFLNRSQHKVAVAVREKFLGLWEGIISLKTMKGQVGFYGFTILIWVSYIMMCYVTFYAFPETENVPFAGVLAAFAMGGLTIALVQGGLGAYPLGVMSILLLYGVDRELGYAFGWITWAAQTAMIIILGFLSIIAMPLINTTSDEAVEQV